MGERGRSGLRCAMGACRRAWGPLCPLYCNCSLSPVGQSVQLIAESSTFRARAKVFCSPRASAERSATTVFCWLRAYAGPFSNARCFACLGALAASLLPSRFQRCWATSTGGRAKRVAEPREKTRAGRESHTPCFGRGARFLRNASRSASVRASPYEHLCTLGRSFALPARLCAPRRKRDAPAIDRQDGFSKTAVVWCNG
jgi:hypothetical protein